MKFIVYGLNHTTAPLAVRERYALPPEKVREALKNLGSQAPEAVFLSTCNRVEFYLATDKPEESREAVLKTLESFHRLKPAEIKKYFYYYEGVDAFLHLFRVASSLDSMVVGEAQILGQVKEAYQQSHAIGMTKSSLNGVFHRAFSAAKRVRSQTEIACMPVNISSVAVDLARKIFSPLSGHEALVLGAGEMSELTAKYLVDAGVAGLFIANRTLEKAKSLAAKLGGTALGLEEGLGKLKEVDIVLTSVSGSQPLLKKEDLERTMKSRNGRPLFIIDIGVPRNVDPAASKIDSIYLYNVDDLSSVAEGNRGQRIKAVESAEAILKEEVDHLCAWITSLELVPSVVRLREKFEKVRRTEWEEFLQKNPELSEKDKKVFERLTKDILGKILHDPSVKLRALDSAADRFEYARMLNEIFALLETKDDP